jgi:hypothetical protein
MKIQYILHSVVSMTKSSTKDRKAKTKLKVSFDIEIKQQTIPGQLTDIPSCQKVQHVGKVDDQAGRINTNNRRVIEHIWQDR